MRPILACSTSFSLAFAAHAQAAPPPSAYQAVVSDYFAGEWRASPTTATSVGLHDWDAQLDDVSAGAHAREAARLTTALKRLKVLNGAALSPIDRDDRDILIARIEGQLLQEQTVQGWRHNPATYVDLMTGAVYSLIERDFAPAPERMRCVIAREKAIPAMLAAAKQNLTDIPAVYVDIALENLDGAPDFLGKDVPSTFAEVGDPALKAELDASTHMPPWRRSPITRPI